MKNYQLYRGDSSRLLKSIPPQEFQLIIASPPYNLGKAYESQTTLSKYLNQQAQTLALLVERLAPQGSLCWQVGNCVLDKEIYPLDIYYYEMFKKLGLKLRNRIIWHFRHGLHSQRRFSGRYETILWFTKSDDYIFNLDDVRVPARYPKKRHFKGPKKGQLSGNPLGKNPSDLWEVLQTNWEQEVWDIPNVKSNHVEKTIHPCQFPVELVERCGLALTHPGDWVLDPYAGVGSSLIAALKQGRKAVGIEKKATYVRLAELRLQAFKNGELKLRPMTQPVYDYTQSSLSAGPQQPEFFCHACRSLL